MVLDAALPTQLAERLAAPAPITAPDSRAVATWIAESPGMLKEYAKRKRAYIPFGTGSVAETVLPLDATWKWQLQEGRWVFTVGGGGPYQPGDVLTEPDPARPDAPIADLPPDFLRALREAGFVFGARLPDAPAVLRLRVRGPSAPADELLRLARAALGEARSNPKKLNFLKETFRGGNLFPLPPGRKSPDRLSRVPLDRVVQSERGRSTFGSWLATADSFPGSPRVNCSNWPAPSSRSRTRQPPGTR